MMSEPRGGGRRRGPGRTAEDRIVELETRLERLEDAPGLRERSRSLMNRVMPPEASHHFRNAGREQLLGMRAIVDFWIARIDDAEARTASASRERETIDIE
jgi:hypothetical protein